MTLFVGNIPFETTVDDLKILFAQHGVVTDARIISDRETGKSRGFGFVEVRTEHAPKIIDAMNGTELQGRHIQVKESEKRGQPAGKR